MFAKVNCPASLATVFASILPVATLRSLRRASLMGVLSEVQAFPRMDVPRGELNAGRLGEPGRTATGRAVPGRAGGGSAAPTLVGTPSNTTATTRSMCRMCISRLWDPLMIARLRRQGVANLHLLPYRRRALDSRDRIPNLSELSGLLSAAAPKFRIRRGISVSFVL